MNLQSFKTLEELSRKILPYLSGLRTLSGLNVGSIGSSPTANDLKVAGELRVGSPSSPLTGVGDATFADDIRVEGDAVIVGTLTGGTHTHTGLVTNGNSHNHDGGDGATIGEGGVSFSGKLVTNGDSHNHDGGDGGAIDTNAIALGAITYSRLDANCVYDDNIGYRVPMFTRRQGGSSTSWTTQGTTSYTPTTVKMQGGSRSCAANVDTTITFPQAFAYAPLVLISFSNRSSWFAVWSISSTQFTINNEFASEAHEIDWLAIGQE